MEIISSQKGKIKVKVTKTVTEIKEYELDLPILCSNGAEREDCFTMYHKIEKNKTTFITKVDDGWSF